MGGHGQDYKISSFLDQNVRLHLGEGNEINSPVQNFGVGTILQRGSSSEELRRPIFALRKIKEIMAHRRK